MVSRVYAEKMRHSVVRSLSLAKRSAVSGQAPKCLQKAISEALVVLLRGKWGVCK